MATDGSSSETMQIDCCIVGGGPAGMILGFHLARAGIEVLVLVTCPLIANSSR